MIEKENMEDNDDSSDDVDGILRWGEECGRAP